MAKLIGTETPDEHTHLRGADGKTLCGKDACNKSGPYDGELTCPECAQIALSAIELSTKAERRKWRQL